MLSKQNGLEHNTRKLACSQEDSRVCIERWPETSFELIESIISNKEHIRVNNSMVRSIEHKARIRLN
jgi:hypothetical protein